MTNCLCFSGLLIGFKSFGRHLIWGRVSTTHLKSWLWHFFCREPCGKLVATYFPLEQKLYQLPAWVSALVGLADAQVMGIGVIGILGRQRWCWEFVQQGGGHKWLPGASPALDGGWVLGLCSLPTTQDPAKLALKPGLLLQAWPQRLYLKHTKIHRAGLCQDFIASGGVKSHFAPSFLAVPPQVFQRGVPVLCGKAERLGVNMNTF